MPNEVLPDAEGDPDRAKPISHSMARCEASLGVSREYLRLIADNAGSYYRPFVKKDRIRPFPRKFKPPKKRPRIIDNPCGELKRLQKKINEKLLKPIALPEYLCGGVPGKSVIDNVLMHADARALVTVDIKRFFRKITNVQVYNVWRNLLNYPPKVAGLLTRLTTFERHLPQGAPTSSLLANLVLYSADRPIREHCEQRGVKYSTWVDDLAFSGVNPRIVIPVAAKSLAQAGFSISHGKLKVMGPGTRKVLNGVIVNRFPGVLRERMSHLRSGIHKLQTQQVSPHEMGKYVRQLEGGIAYVGSISPRKAAKLRAQLEEAARPFRLAAQ